MWSEERVARLRKYWAEGLSASQIAKLLGGVTRNAVIGKVHRLKLEARAPSPPTRTYKRRVKEQKAQPLAFSLGGFCRFPIGDPQDESFSFCGNSRHNGPYCSTHARVCYVPLTKRQKASTERLVNWMDRRTFKATASV